MELDGAAVLRLLARAAERLDGSWLLVDGALVASWLDGERRTQDVDLIGPEGAREERMALLDLAEEVNLPIEALNSAADFFVRRIDGWEDETRVLLEGSRGRSLRPTVTLFLLTKLRRLSETDLADCRAALAWARDQSGDQPGELDTARVAAALDALAPTADAELATRRGILRRELDVS